MLWNEEAAQWWGVNYKTVVSRHRAPRHRTAPFGHQRAQDGQVGTGG
jgi:hypothetical protein